MAIRNLFLRILCKDYNYLNIINKALTLRNNGFVFSINNTFYNRFDAVFNNIRTIEVIPVYSDIFGMT